MQVAAATEAGLGDWSDFTYRHRASPNLARPAGLFNMARNKPVAASSILNDDNEAEEAVDGERNGPLFRSEESENPWWRVDLGSRKRVWEVVIYQRTNCCRGRGQGGMVYVSDTPSWSAGTACEGIMNPHGSNPVTLPCNAIGRYVYVRLQKTKEFLELREVEVMVDEKCDTRTPLNTNTEGTCTGARDGDSCTATCQAGYAKSSGEETAVCRFGEWSVPEPVCVKQCPSVPAPLGTETCTQTVAREQFTKLASGADPNLEPILRFASLDEDTFPLNEYWGVIDGRMVAGAPAVDGSMGKCLLPGQGMVAMLQDPDPSAIDGSVKITVKLAGEDDAGLVFGAAGPSTYTFVSLGFVTGKHRLVKRIGGVDIELGSSRASVRALDSSIPMDKHELEVRQDGASLLALLDNVRLFQVEDKAALVGDVGLWTQGRAEFDDLEVHTACLTSGGAAVSGCRDLFYQDTCGFTCRQGFDLVGQQQVGCKADGSLSSAAPDCSIRPPVALDQNRTVVEESDRNTAVVTPWWPHWRPTSRSSSLLRGVIRMGPSRSVCATG